MVGHESRWWKISVRKSSGSVEEFGNDSQKRNQEEKEESEAPSQKEQQEALDSQEQKADARQSQEALYRAQQVQPRRETQGQNLTNAPWLLVSHYSIWRSCKGSKERKQSGNPSSNQETFPMNSVPQYGWTRRGFQMPVSMMGLSGSSQQGDAKAVAGSLQQLADAAMKSGDPIASAVLETGAALANIVSLFGPNPNNTITTEWVNQMEADVMRPNLLTWQALAPEDKTPQAQAYALEVFSQGWNQIVQLCSNPQLGSAGSNCLRDRQRGGKWDWWAYYYDPIAKDPQVAANVAAAKAAAAAALAAQSTPVDTSTPGSAGGSNTGTTLSASVTAPSKLFLWGGLALVAFALGYVLTEGD
jgi:hypothetical protein